MDVIRHGDRTVTALRWVVGWTSWFIVAVHIYAFAWWSIDPYGSYYFVLSDAAYVWLDDVVGPTTQDATFDLEVWSTAVSVVLGLHVVAWIVVSCLKLARREIDWVRHGWQKKIVTVVGWSSWLLVATFALIMAWEATYLAKSGGPPAYGGCEGLVLFGGILVVGSLHVAALTAVRRRRN
jgi:hypothetical protein